MKLLLNEKIHIQNMIENNEFSFSFEKSFYMLSKYLNEQGYSKGETLSYLIKMCSEKNIDLNIDDRSDKLSYLVDVAYEYNKPVINIKSIPVSKSEWECISRLKTESAKKIAYALLINVKAKGYVAGKPIEWFNGKPEDLIREAKIKLTVEEKMATFHYLYKEGILIDTDRLDTHALRCLFIDYDDSRIEFEVFDFDNIMNDYNLYTGETIVCKECGVIFKKPKGKGKGKSPYCSETCRKESLKRQKREYINKKRSENKEM